MKIISIFLTIILVLVGSAPLQVKAYYSCSQYTGSRDTNLENQIINEYREYRRWRNMYVPNVYWRFNNGASTRLQYMLERNYISHDYWLSNLQGCGITPWTGEVISLGMSDAKAILHAWDASPSHRYAIQYSGIRYFGVRCANYPRNVWSVSGFGTNKVCIMVLSD